MFFTWLAKIAINKELELLRHTPINPPIIAFILVCILSTALGLASGHVKLLESFFYLLKYVEYFMVFFMVTNNIRSKEQVRNFIVVFLITCTITCIYGIATSGQYVSGRASAPFEGPGGEPNTLGGYLVIIFALVGGIFLYSPSGIWQFSSVVLACLISLTLLKTFSRSSYLAFITVYLTLTFFSKRKKLLLVVILILGIFLFPSILPRRVIQRVTSTFIPGIIYEPFGRRVPLELSAASRLERSKMVVKRWMERPLLGYGVSGVGMVDSQYPRVLGEVGIVGFLVFVWLIIAIIKYALYNFNNIESNWAKGLRLGFLAGFLGLLTHCFGANTFIIVRIMEPFWFMAAVVMSLPRLFLPKEEAE
jgi:O-antigen ligase